MSETVPPVWLPQTVIEVPNSDIVLKTFTPDDVEEIFALIDANRQHLSNHGEDTSEKYPTLDKLLNSIIHPKTLARLRFAIRAGGKLVGSINITADKNDHSLAEIGYYLAENETGHGYVTRSVNALCDYALQKLNIKTVFGVVHPNNLPSRRVLERCGFIEAGKESDGGIRLERKLA